MSRSLVAALGLGLSAKGMDMVTTFRPERSAVYGWLPHEPFTGAWQRNMECAAPHQLTAFSAVYACISRIVGDFAKLAPRLMQRQADGTWRPAPENSPHWLPLRTPNPIQNRIQFFTAWMLSKLLYGNAYVLKVRDGRDMVARMYVLDPRRVMPLVTMEGDVYYNLSGDDLARVPAGSVAPASEIIHDRGLTLWHPLVGVSPIMACALSGTQGLRIQQNSARFFENMSRPSGVLSGPGVIDDQTAARLKAAWEENFRSGGIGKLAVLGDGLKYEPMAVPANEAQLIEQLKWTVEDTARAFSMPLYKIGAGPMPTANNVEGLHQQYYSDCLQVPIEAAELCLDEGLAVPPGYCVEFDLDGLLRMDQATQIDMLAKSVGGAIRSPNEARAKLNLPPKVGGDSIYLQEQNYSLEALAKRDASADPFGTAPAPAPAPSTGAEDPDPEDPEEQDAPEDDANDDAAEQRAIDVLATMTKAFDLLPALEAADA